MLADMAHTTDTFTAALTWRSNLRMAFERVFQSVDVLITPTTATLRKEIGSELVEAGAEPEPYRPALSWFTTLVNQSGIPAIALPLAGTADAGPPVSVQVIGPWFSEDRLLGIGLALEASGIIGFTPPW